MTTITATGGIIIKPGTAHGWIMVTQRPRWEMYFHTRQRALQFARAYAKLNPPAAIQVLGESGNIETEETFEDRLRDTRQATSRGSPGS